MDDFGQFANADRDANGFIGRQAFMAIFQGLHPPVSLRELQLAFTAGSRNSLLISRQAFLSVGTRLILKVPRILPLSSLKRGSSIIKEGEGEQEQEQEEKIVAAIGKRWTTIAPHIKRFLRSIDEGLQHHDFNLQRDLANWKHAMAQLDEARAGTKAKTVRKRSQDILFWYRSILYGVLTTGLLYGGRVKEQNTQEQLIAAETQCS